jgi:RNA polymerase sigma factor (sigma-70 family)
MMVDPLHPIRVMGEPRSASPFGRLCAVRDRREGQRDACPTKENAGAEDKAIILSWTGARWKMGQAEEARPHGGRRFFPDRAGAHRLAPVRRVQGPARRSDPQLHSGNSDPSRGRGPLTEDQRGLAARYLPLARALAQRVKAPWPAEEEELQSIAYMALVEAAQRFDPSRNVNFATYARHRIRGALRDCQRLLFSPAWRSDRPHGAIFQKLGEHAEKYGQVIGIRPDRPIGTQIEATEAVEEWLKRLPRAHAAACRLIYLGGKSQDEAAALVGCSKSFLSRLHREAITSLIRDYQAARASQDQEISQASD